MAAKSKKPPVFRAPTQQRSKETLARIYAATNELLKEKNFDQVTMAELSKRADVTIGSIYQRFGSKDQLLWVMYAAYLEEATEKLEVLFATSSGHSLEDRTQRIIGLMFDLFSTHTGVIRSLLVKHRQDPDSIPDQHRDQMNNAFDSVARYITLETQDPLDDDTVLYAVSVIFASSREMILFREFQWSSPTALNKSEFVAKISSAAIAILKAKK